jgi:hypothetical protein
MIGFGENGGLGYGLASRSSGRCAACRGTGQVVVGGATRGTVPTSYRCTACQGTMNCPVCRELEPRPGAMARARAVIVLPFQNFLQ